MIAVATLIIQGVVLIPVFLIVQKLGWFSSYAGWCSGAAGAFRVFLGNSS